MSGDTTQLLVANLIVLGTGILVAWGKLTAIAVRLDALTQRIDNHSPRLSDLEHRVVTLETLIKLPHANP